MPAKSKKQQRFMGMVHATQKGKLKDPSPEVARAAASMKSEDAKDFAKTKHKGLPDKVEEKQSHVAWVEKFAAGAMPQPLSDERYHLMQTQPPSLQGQPMQPPAAAPPIPSPKPTGRGQLIKSPQQFLRTPGNVLPPVDKVLEDGANIQSTPAAAQAASAAMRPAPKTAESACKVKKAPRYKSQYKTGKKVMPRPHDDQLKKVKAAGDALATEHMRFAEGLAEKRAIGVVGTVLGGGLGYLNRRDDESETDEVLRGAGTGFVTETGAGLGGTLGVLGMMPILSRLADSRGHVNASASNPGRFAATLAALGLPIAGVGLGGYGGYRLGKQHLWDKKEEQDAGNAVVAE